MPATSRSTIATRAACLALCISLSSPDDKRRDYGEREIDQCQTPQCQPIMRDLPDAGAKLVDAHKAINCRVGGEHPAQRLRRVGDGFAWPCETGGEELGQAGGKEENRRVFRTGKPG